MVAFVNMQAERTFGTALKKTVGLTFFGFVPRDDGSTSSTTRRGPSSSKDSGPSSKDSPQEIIAHEALTDSKGRLSASGGRSNLLERSYETSRLDMENSRLNMENSRLNLDGSRYGSGGADRYSSRESRTESSRQDEGECEDKPLLDVSCATGKEQMDDLMNLTGGTIMSPKPDRLSTSQRQQQQGNTSFTSAMTMDPIQDPSHYCVQETIQDIERDSIRIMTDTEISQFCDFYYDTTPYWWVPVCVSAILCELLINVILPYFLGASRGSPATKPILALLTVLMNTSGCYLEGLVNPPVIDGSDQDYSEDPNNRHRMLSKDSIDSYSDGPAAATTKLKKHYLPDVRILDMKTGFSAGFLSVLTSFPDIGDSASNLVLSEQGQYHLGLGYCLFGVFAGCAAYFLASDYTNNNCTKSTEHRSIFRKLKFFIGTLFNSVMCFLWSLVSSTWYAIRHPRIMFLRDWSKPNSATRRNSGVRRRRASYNSNVVEEDPFFGNGNESPVLPGSAKLNDSLSCGLNQTHDNILNDTLNDSFECGLAHTINFDDNASLISYKSGDHSPERSPFVRKEESGQFLEEHFSTYDSIDRRSNSHESGDAVLGGNYGNLSGNSSKSSIRSTKNNAIATLERRNARSRWFLLFWMSLSSTIMFLTVLIIILSHGFGISSRLDFQNVRQGLKSNEKESLDAKSGDPNDVTLVTDLSRPDLAPPFHCCLLGLAIGCMMSCVGAVAGQSTVNWLARNYETICYRGGYNISVGSPSPSPPRSAASHGTGGVSRGLTPRERITPRDGKFPSPPGKLTPRAPGTGTGLDRVSRQHAAVLGRACTNIIACMLVFSTRVVLQKYQQNSYLQQSKPTAQGDLHIAMSYFLMKVTTSGCGALSCMSGTIADVSQALLRDTKAGTANIIFHLTMVLACMLFTMHLTTWESLEGNGILLTMQKRHWVQENHILSQDRSFGSSLESTRTGSDES